MSNHASFKSSDNDSKYKKRFFHFNNELLTLNEYSVVISAGISVQLWGNSMFTLAMYVCLPVAE